MSAALISRLERLARQTRGHVARENADLRTSYAVGYPQIRAYTVLDFYRPFELVTRGLAS